MKIKRSTKCTLRFTTEQKQKQLRVFLVEYCRVVNFYIKLFWFNPPGRKNDLTATVICQADKKLCTWLSYRGKQDAARQAVSMIYAAKERYKTAKENGERCKPCQKRPVLRRLKAVLSTNCVHLQLPEKAHGFDTWLHIGSFDGRKRNVSMDIPVKLHKHFHELQKIGKRGSSVVVTDKHIQFSFTITTGAKLNPTGCIGVDSGIKALASLSNGQQLGTEIEDKIDRVNRCKHGSKGQQRARRALRHYIDSVAKQLIVIAGVTLVVVERLKNITKNTKQNHKRRLCKNMRRTIGAWNLRHWLMRVEQQCERNRVSFRTVPAYNTSRTCPACGHCNKKNRNGEQFVCLQCGHADNADINASKNILNRYLSDDYAVGCKPLPDRRNLPSMTSSRNSRSNEPENAALQSDIGKKRRKRVA